ncbi:MAG TPA: NAD(P)H-quinone oxidoreductase [Longimicrobiales bacterium]|nr:NAD(P)H-quinone oxidoreductase [Longimicrobiales bacterium]
MKAVIITKPGNPDVLQISDVDTPTPGADQVLVRVHATAVNRADLMQRRGNYPPPPGYRADIPGLEYAGVIEANGDRVMGIIGGASYAEYVVVHEGEAMPVPSNLSLEEAAAIPEAFLTAYDALHARLHLQRGETVLIHAVASGVGTAALQLAKQLGCFVIGTARSDEKLERAIELGLDVAVNAARESFVDVVRSHTDGRGVDAVVDLVGGDYLTGNVQALALRGRIVVVGLVAGASAPLDMRLLLNKRATIVGTVMRARSLEEKIQVAQDVTRDVIPLFESGAVVPVVDAVFPMSEVVRAHEIVEGNRNFGKIVLKW